MKSVRIFIAAMSLCFLTITFCSCGSTRIASPGPERPDSEVAYVEGWNHYYILYLSYGKLKIDGMRNPDWTWTVSAKVLPGPHWLEVWERSHGYLPLYPTRTCAMEMDFEAGHSYKLVPNSIESKGPLFSNIHKVGKISTGTILVKITDPKDISRIQQFPVVCTNHIWGFCRRDPDCIGPHPVSDDNWRCIPDEISAFGLCRNLGLEGAKKSE